MRLPRSVREADVAGKTDYFITTHPRNPDLVFASTSDGV